MATESQQAVETVWRMEAPRLIAGLARIVRGDIGLAEDLAQDALVAALEQWPSAGIPRNPGAWLMQAAKHRAIDQLRRRHLLQRKHEEIAYALERDQNAMPTPEDRLDDNVGDDLLRLIFIACHPILSTEGRVALTLRLLGGLTTDEIARAFLAPEPTIAQRIVRAKKALARAGVPFEVPRSDALTERIAPVLEVVYLIFNEGYSATSGDDWMRPELCQEAMRLGRILSELSPDEAEVHGLVALMELQASRLRARTGPDGAPILLLDQNRSLWDRVLIQHGLGALARAERLGGRGPYVLQASIAACHARAFDPAQTDWSTIADLYAELAELTPSPVIDLNRAVAIGMADGAAAALPLVDRLAEEGALARYHLLAAVRGDLLNKLGRHEEARGEFERAASLTTNTRERKLLLARAGRATQPES